MFKLVRQDWYKRGEKLKWVIFFHIKCRGDISFAERPFHEVDICENVKEYFLEQK